MMIRYLSIILPLLLLTVSIPATAQEDEVIQRVNEYVELLKAEKYGEAKGYWALLDQSRSEDLKIEYENCPLKLEIGSPLWQHLSEIRAGTAEFRVSVVSIARDYAKVTYSILLPADTLWGTHYFLVGGVTEPQLVATPNVYTDSWESTETDFLRLRYRDETIFNTQAAAQTDQFIRELGKKLGVSNEKMFILETIKLNGVLCGTYGEVELITGKQALGTFMKNYDGIVSKHFPPFHEIARFMVAYANEKLPPVTLPFMEYGTATFLGGRWGRSADVLEALGSYLYLNDLVSLDTLITAKDFATFNANPDFAYPLAGLFCNFLFDKLGRADYFKLYRQLSGSDADVAAITRADFQKAVGTATGTEWSSLIAEFKSWLPDNDSGRMAAGASEAGKLVYETGLKGILLRMYEDSLWYNVVARVDDPDTKAAILLRQRYGSKYSSSLFQEQFPDTIFDNYQYGILFSNVEAGAYSYVANNIIGKYIVGMTGDEPIYDPSSGEIRFRVDKAILPPLDGYVMFIQFVK